MMTYFKNKNIWFWGFIILLVINVSAISTMMYHGRMMRERHPDFKFREMTGGNPHTYMMKRLQLTEEQGEQFKAIHEVYREKVKDLKIEVRNDEVDLLKLSAQASDSVALALKIEELGKLQLELTKSTLHMYKELRAVCTPEQHEELEKMFTKFISIRNYGVQRGPKMHNDKRNSSGKQRGRYRNNP